MLANCYFCGTSCLNERPLIKGDIPGAGNCLLLKTQLLNYFILRKVLDIAEISSLDFLNLRSSDYKIEGDHDDDGSRLTLKICESCLKVVENAWNIYQKIVALQLEFKVYQKKLKDVMNVKRENECRSFMECRIRNRAAVIADSITTTNDKSNEEEEFWMEDNFSTAVPVKIEAYSFEDPLSSAQFSPADHDHHLGIESEEADPIMSQDDNHVEAASLENAGGSRKNSKRSSQQITKVKKTGLDKPKRKYKKRDEESRKLFEQWKDTFLANKEEKPSLAASRPRRLRNTHFRYTPRHPDEDKKSRNIKNRKQSSWNLGTQDGFKKCSICRHSCKDEESLENHMILHSVTWHCPALECSFQTQIPRILKRHVYIVHRRLNEEEISKVEEKRKALCAYQRRCDNCPKKFQLLSRMLKHINGGTCRVKKGVREKYICEDCGAEFLKRKSWRTHRIRMHSTPEEASKLKVICHLCGLDYNNRGYLNIHYQKFHKGQIGGLEKTSEKVPPEKLFKCDFCDVTSPFKIVIRRHEKIHLRSGEAGYKCKQCDKGYRSESALYRHTRIFHAKNKIEVSCPHCDKKFRAKDYLWAHIAHHCPKAKEAKNAEGT